MTLSGAVSIAREQIKREEGCRLHAYPDPLTGGEPYTIGWGHTGDDVEADSIWTQEKADLTFDTDLAGCVSDLDSNLLWWDELNEPRMAVLLSMVFQMGIGRVLKFRNALQAMEAGDWPEAAAEMLDSSWAAQTPARAKRLSRQMLTGVVA